LEQLSRLHASSCGQILCEHDPTARARNSIDYSNHIRGLRLNIFVAALVCGAGLL
jgi:hypothetical protein